MVGRSDISVTIGGDTSRLEAALRDVDGRLAGFGSGIRNTAAFAAAGAAIGIVADQAWDAINAASDLQETVSRAGVIFGDAAGDIEAFGETAASALGMSKNEAIGAASTFGVFGQAAGLAGDDLAAFSTDFTTLAGDLASFNNTSPEEAVTAIGAALRGESEPIRRYGVLLDDATLKARAMALGIYDGVGALDQQTRVLAAQAEIIAQTSNAQGDFTRTSGGLANQMRILKAQLSDVQAEIGEKLLPVAVELATWFNNEGIPALYDAGAAAQEFGQTVGDIWGHVSPLVDKMGAIFIPMLESAAALLRLDIKDAVVAFGEGLWELATGPVDMAIWGVKELAGGVEALGDELGIGEEHTADYVVEMAGVARRTALAGDSVSTFERRLADSNREIGEGERATRDWSNVTVIATGEAASAWGDLAGVMVEYFDKLRGQNDAQIAFEQAVDDMIGAVAEAGLTFDITTAAGRDQVQTVEELETAVRDHMLAVLEQTGSMEEAETAGYGLVDSFIEQALEAGLTRDQVADLAAKLLSIPSEVSTNYYFNPGAGSLDSLYNVDSLLASIAGYVAWLQAHPDVPIYIGPYSRAAETPDMGAGGGGGGKGGGSTITLRFDPAVFADVVIDESQIRGGLPILIRASGEAA